jgi:hypothetical protein
MYLDRQNLFSAAQAITTGSTASTDIIDLGSSRDIGAGEPLEVIVAIDATFTSGGAGTLDVKLQTDTSSGFGSAVTLASTGATALASLTAGAAIARWKVPRGVLRYLRLQYVVATADMTAGTITAGIGIGRQDTATYADAL